MMLQLNDSPAYLLRLPCSTSRLRFSGPVSSVNWSVRRVSKGGGEGELTPAGDRDGVSIRADKSVCCPPFLCRRSRSRSHCSAFSNGICLHIFYVCLVPLLVYVFSQF